DVCSSDYGVPAGRRRARTLVAATLRVAGRYPAGRAGRTGADRHRAARRFPFTAGGEVGMATVTPTGVWTLRLGAMSLLLHRRNWLMFALLSVVLALLVVLAISLGSGNMGVRDALATLAGNGSKL